MALRYAPAMLSDVLGREDLQATSLREGERLLKLPDYEGVHLLLLDDTTCMYTGTYKSLAGCIGTAMCQKHGIGHAVFSSGANTGTALTVYGAKAGLETFFYCPSSTLHKLDGAIFEGPSAHLISVDGPDRYVKEAATRFAQALAVPVIPQTDWRMRSSGCRGCFIAEQIAQIGQPFDWLVQTVCAAYGPIGIYQALRKLCDWGRLTPAEIPSFLGIQQTGFSPIASAWHRGSTSLEDEPPAEWTQSAIEPSLYNARPVETYPLLCDLIRDHGGNLITVDHEELATYAPSFIEMLKHVGISLTTHTINGETILLEKAGLLAGLGMLKAIRHGVIRKGTTVLCALTGGTGPAPTCSAKAEFEIIRHAPLEDQIATYVRQMGKRGSPSTF